MSLLRRNASSDYGQRYGFKGIRSAREYQNAVPVVNYEALREQIEAIKCGRQGVLTEEPVVMLEKTSGSVAASKYIPYTASLRREFQAALAPWMADLFGHRCQMLCGGAYWSVSPVASKREVTEGGLPVGFDEDTEYFGPLQRRLLARLILTPRELPHVLDMEASRYITLRFLVQTPRLCFISVWNPSFLTLLMGALVQHMDRLVKDICAGTLTPPAPVPPELQRRLASQLRPRPERARQLQHLRAGDGTLPLADVWPHLRLISCWASAGASRDLPALCSLFPGIEIQPKGLLATEGIVSIPVTGHPGGALAVTSHFLEFIDEECPDNRPRLIDELERQRTYRVLLTTGGGLYRYALADRIQVLDHLRATPLIEFLGKADHISDLCGEKLHERRVREVLEAVFGEFNLEPTFAMIAPELGQPPFYTLYIEDGGVPTERLEKVARGVERALTEGHHYGYCRRLGQLGPLRIRLVQIGASGTYLERCAALGQRRGSIKPVALHCEPGWLEWFTMK